MANFSPQLVMPAAGDPYYNTIKTGGFNPCILGNAQRREKNLNVLPNCVGYATGRFNQIYHEILGGHGCQYLGNTNAANYVDLGRRQGLRISQKPTPGGCMVWKGGNTGEGHVAIVELMMGSRIITSESEYYGKAFTIYQRFGSNWSDGCYWMGSSYKYLGCIVNPAMQDEKEDEMSKEEIREIVVETMKEEIPGMIREYLKDLGKLPASWWAEGAIKRVRESKIMVGDPATKEYPEGNFRPQSLMTREEAAAIINSFLPDR